MSTEQDRFSEVLERLHTEHERLVDLANDEDLHWATRMRALKRSEDIYTEWRRVRKAAREAGALAEEVPFMNFDPYQLQNTIFEGHQGEKGIDVTLLPPRLRCEHGRVLEEKAADLRREDRDLEAELVFGEAKDAYYTLVEEEFQGTVPYRRLAILHRRLGEHEAEQTVAARAVDVARCTDNPREWFEERRSRAQELRETEG